MSKITQKELEKSILEKNLKNLYFFIGSEKNLINDVLENLKIGVLGNNFNDFNFIALDGENISAEEVSDAVETLPVNSEKKCIFLKNFSPENLSDNEFKKFLEIIADIPDFSVLAITQKSQIDLRNSSKLTKFKNAVEKTGNIVAFEQKCISNEHKINIFDCLKAVMASDLKKALNFAENLFQDRADPVMMVAVLSSGFIDVLRAKMAQNSNLPVSKVSEIFDYKGKEFKLQIAESHAKKMSFSQISKCINLLTKADETLKSSTLEVKLVIEKLIIELITG